VAEKYAVLSVAVELEYASFNKWMVVFQLENITVAAAQKSLRFYITVTAESMKL
jgi:hypothetical protein